jgi:hypothetical protein
MKLLKKRKFFEYDEKSLTYKETKLDSHKILLAAIAVPLMFIIILFFSTKDIHKDSKTPAEKHIPMMMEDMNPSHNKAWKDSVFTDYHKRAKVYLSRGEFTGTPLTAKLLTLCARNTYDSTGVLVPVELVLLQAQVESSMGRAGRSPKNNPFNLGEAVSGTTQWYKSTFDGTQAYYYLMARNYLGCKSVEELLLNFTNCNGHRYAESPTYEIKMSSEYIKIKRWIDNNL